MVVWAFWGVWTALGATDLGPMVWWSGGPGGTYCNRFDLGLESRFYRMLLYPFPVCVIAYTAIGYGTARLRFQLLAAFCRSDLRHYSLPAKANVQLRGA